MLDAQVATRDKVVDGCREHHREGAHIATHARSATDVDELEDLWLVHKITQVLLFVVDAARYGRVLQLKAYVLVYFAQTASARHVIKLFRVGAIHLN